MDMTTHNTNIENIRTGKDFNWSIPDLASLQQRIERFHFPIPYRLFHITEISESKSEASRLAMANVISTLSSSDCSLIYILTGTAQGIRLYMGVAANSTQADIPEADKSLQTAFEGNFLGAHITGLKQENKNVTDLYSNTRHLGLVTGIPSFNETEIALDGEDFQGIERLANSLHGETWQLTIVASPAGDCEIMNTLEHIYDLSTEISSYIKRSVQQSENTGWQETDTKGESASTTEGTSSGVTNGKTKGASENTNSSNSSNSKGTSTGTSESRSTSTSTSKVQGTSGSLSKGASGGSSIATTQEFLDKRLEEIQKHLNETLIQRLRLGRSKGMFNTCIYVTAPKATTYERLARGVLSTFQGNQPSITPLQVHKLKVDPDIQLSDLVRKRWFISGQKSENTSLIHSMTFDSSSESFSGETRLNASELALLTGLPSKELPGLKIRECVDFALNTSEVNDSDSHLSLGKVVQHGRILPYSPVAISKDVLNKHTFVTGVTGSGKTTTCMRLLLESKLPFLVIEPAKTEYRALHSHCEQIDYYCLGREELTPFRLNPFELVSEKQNLASHVKVLSATMAAVFPMEAAMPQIVEEAIIMAYTNKGWDIHTGENFYSENPWEQGSKAWPIFSDMISCLEVVIKSKGMGREFEEKYQGSLVARLTNLTLGANGRMLNTPQSFNFDQMLDRKTVIELEEIKDEKDKALFMGLIIQRLAECMKHRHRIDPEFQHLTLIEEAHRLLSNPEPGDSGSKKMGVEMFANLLAEVRKYGEGLIIADQIPNKLIPDVIKNTNTKIVHRLFAADDRRAMGDAMGLSEKQRDFLPYLMPGETVVYSGGWHASVRTMVDRLVNTNAADIPESEIQKRGQQQLWKQRHQLLPDLAKLEMLDTPEKLSIYAKESRLLLSILIRLARDHNKFGINEKVQMLQKRLTKKFSECQNILGDTPERLAEILVTQFTTDSVSEDFTYDDLALFNQVLVPMILASVESVKAFDSFTKETIEMRQVSQVLITNQSF